MKYFALLMLFLIVQVLAKRPNIIFILTDDQNLDFNTLNVMPNVRNLIYDQGINITNSYTSVGVCCPSRSSILTGLYPHNTHVINNSDAGNCYSSEWINGPEKKSISTYMQRYYTTFLTGKY